MSIVTSDDIFHFAFAHHQLGQLPQAETLCRQILATQPQHPDALHLLGVIAGQMGFLNAAADLIRQAIAVNPIDAAYHNDLGNVFSTQGDLGSAVICYQYALEIKPNYADAHNNLGNALSGQGRIAEAIACFQHALEINPRQSEALNNIGIALAGKGEPDEAIRCFRKALELSPDFAQAHHNLGTALLGEGHSDEAVACFEKALAIQPNFASACNNLGLALSGQGRMDKALECYRRTMTLAPDNPSFHSNLLFTLHFDPACQTAVLREEHRRWDEQHGKPRQQFIRPHDNVSDPQRRLKIGYVSPDLRDHPVGRFLLPVLENHNHSTFEIFCYADALCPDAVTDRLRAYTDCWQDTAGWPEGQMAEQIRKDNIDVLVDLALHTAANRLPVFARKPAPVQVSFAGYPGTTGLDAIDYRLSDPYLDPPGRDTQSSEEVICLPDSFWLFAPPEGCSAVAALPALSNRQITFGCLGNFGKVNTQVLALWARVLNAVPGSHIFLLVSEGSHREQTRETLQDLGIAAERVEFVKPCARVDYFALYQAMDIILDTFPYNGHNTTLDALWMGVPVVSLVGQTAVGRGGLSILSNIGLPELVAYTEEEYIKIAVDLANNLPRLTQLRTTMRKRMLASPLMDAPRFARNMEDAYRAVWSRWCEEQKRLPSIC